MLSNQDIAELLQSTRQRVQHMGGDTAASAGVVRVLDGLIAMLCETAPQEDEAAAASEFDSSPGSSRRGNHTGAAAAGGSSSNHSGGAESEGDSEAAPVPGYLEHLRATRRRRPVREAASPPKPANPLSSPQYAGFFNALIASQKSPGSEDTSDASGGSADETSDQTTEDFGTSAQQSPPPARADRHEARESRDSRPGARSTINPQYKGFFDALAASQRPSESSSAPSGSDENVSAEEPQPQEPAEFRSPEPEPAAPMPRFRDETATG